jgi:hypothetical protein
MKKQARLCLIVFINERYAERNTRCRRCVSQDKASAASRQEEAAMIAKSNHARVRQAQRNLTDDEVAFIMRHGRRIRSGGALHIFLGRRDIPNDRAIFQKYHHLEGATLVINDKGYTPVLITVYRNRRALRDIRRKQKYNRAMAAEMLD